jgi:hypothetical protein
MKVGDLVRFRKESRAWVSYDMEPDAKGRVIEVYTNVQVKGAHKVDVSFPGTSALKRAIDVTELEIVGGDHGASINWPRTLSTLRKAKRRRLFVWVASPVFGLLAFGLLTLHVAKAAHREKRIVERARPFCVQKMFTNGEMRRLVRLAYRSRRTNEDAVRAVVALCQGSG